MGQPGFFDIDRRLDALSAKGDPLETIKSAVPWEDFRADIEAATEIKPEDRKSSAGRRPYDAILKFKIRKRASNHWSWLTRQSGGYEVEANRKEALSDDSCKFPHFLIRRPPEELPRTPYLPGFV
jgi:hypothetical protein